MENQMENGITVGVYRVGSLGGGFLYRTVTPDHEPCLKCSPKVNDYPTKSPYNYCSVHFLLHYPNITPICYNSSYFFARLQVLPAACTASSGSGLRHPNPKARNLRVAGTPGMASHQSWGLGFRV